MSSYYFWLWGWTCFYSSTHIQQSSFSCCKGIKWKPGRLSVLRYLCPFICCPLSTETQQYTEHAAAASVHLHQEPLQDLRPNPYTELQQICFSYQTFYSVFSLFSFSGSRKMYVTCVSLSGQWVYRSETHKQLKAVQFTQNKSLSVHLTYFSVIFHKIYIYITQYINNWHCSECKKRTKTDRNLFNVLRWAAIFTKIGWKHCWTFKWYNQAWNG